MQRYATLKQQRGLTLTESLLVLAVAALVAVLAYGGYKMANANVKSMSSVNSTVRLLTAIKKTFGSNSDYTGITHTLVAQSGIVPTDFASNSATGVITAPYGATVTIAADGTDKTRALVTFTSVPSDVCMDLAAGIEGMTDTLSIGGTAVKSSTTPYSATGAAAKCGAAAIFVAGVK